MHKFRLSRLIRGVGAAILLTASMIIWNGMDINDITSMTDEWQMSPSDRVHSRRLRQVYPAGCDVMKDDGCIEAKLDRLFKGMTSGNWTDVYQNQLRRHRHLVSACKKLGLGLETPNFTESSMYVSDALNYIYCGVNKVATTNWKRVLLKVHEAVTVDLPEQLVASSAHDTRTTDQYFTRIRHFSLDAVQRRLKSHFKFIFVRHPMERLVSAYRDKFVKLNEGGYYQRRFGVRAIRMLRGKNASKASLLRGHDLQFQEMVTYLLQPPADPSFNMLSDAHWAPQNGLCHPCYVQYDFIGHHETLFQDAQFVLARLGVDNRVQFPHYDPDNQWKQPTTTVVRDMLSLLSDDQLERLRQIFDVDSELYGYEFSHPRQRSLLKDDVLPLRN